MGNKFTDYKYAILSDRRGGGSRTEKFEGANSRLFDAKRIAQRKQEEHPDRQYFIFELKESLDPSNTIEDTYYEDYTITPSEDEVKITAPCGTAQTFTWDEIDKLREMKP